MTNYTLLKERLESGQYKRARQFINKNLEPGEVALLIETCLPKERNLVWQLVNKDQQGEVLLHLGEEVRQQLIESMDISQLIPALADLDEDDLADILQDLPERLLEEYLAGLESVDRQRIESLLSYPKDSAGGLMNPEIISLRPHTSVDVAKRLLRRKEPLEHIEYIYVTNTKNRLLGILPVTRLINAEAETTAAELMEKNSTTLEVTALASDVVRLFETQILAEVAVVDEQKTLLGRITFDDVFDLIREEGERQRVSFAGGDSGEVDIYASVGSSLYSRALWLGINLLTALLASSVIGLFDATIEKVVALAVLMPIVASMGGIAGTQTLTIMIRGFSRGQISVGKLGWLLVRELKLSLINGIIWATVVGCIAGWWFSSWSIGGILGVAMVINLCLAALVGVFLPAGLRAVKIDPAVSGGVILTTFTDVFGFITFLGLATIFFM